MSVRQPASVCVSVGRRVSRGVLSRDRRRAELLTTQLSAGRQASRLAGKGGLLFRQYQVDFTSLWRRGDTGGYLLLHHGVYVRFMALINYMTWF